MGSQYYNPSGLRKTSAKFIIIGSVVNFVLNLILIPILNSYGAIIATIIAETVISTLYLLKCNGFYSAKELLNCSYKKIIAGIVMFISIFLINYINISLLLKLFIKIIVGILIYIILLIMLKDDCLINIKNINENKK